MARVVHHVLRERVGRDIGGLDFHARGEVG